MKSASAMPKFRPSQYAPLLDPAARCNTIRDRMRVGLVLLTLVHAGEALASDQGTITRGRLDPEFANLRQTPRFSMAMMASPESFAAPAGAGKQVVFSSTDFRPRKHTLFDRDPAVNAFDDAPMLRGTTVWQRMSDYKSHDRVRLLTLWESSGSTVSLQAGQHGNPSLQWNSRVMNRGGSTQGLLDRLFSVSLTRAGNGPHVAARPTTASATSLASKQSGATATAGLK